MIQAHGNKLIEGKFGEFCEAWDYSSCDETSEVRDFAALYDAATLKNNSTAQRLAIISGNACVNRSSLITGTARVLGDSVVNNSVIAETAAVGDRAFVADSLILGRARVMDAAEVVGCIVESTAIVRGGSVLEGIHVDKDYLFHEGLWRRLPWFYGRPDERYPIQECVEGRILIGCLCATVDEWLSDAARRLAFQRFSISEENVEEYLRILRGLK
jgi:carbonic anhydrase/acetyltransferase-like protein (isoleucine patch superfamily)